MTADAARKQIQAILHTQEDGLIGPATLRCLHLLSGLPDDAPWPPGTTAAPNDAGFKEVEASSFADPADIHAFRQCKAHGGTDLHCFGLGDNGIGFTGLDCTE